MAEGLLTKKKRYIDVYILKEELGRGAPAQMSTKLLQTGELAPLVPTALGAASLPQFMRVESTGPMNRGEGPPLKGT